MYKIYLFDDLSFFNLKSPCKRANVIVDLSSFRWNNIFSKKIFKKEKKNNIFPLESERERKNETKKGYKNCSKVL